MAEGTPTPSPEDTNNRLETGETKFDPNPSGLNFPPIAPNHRPVSNLSGVTPFPVSKEANSTPILPKLKSSSSTNQRHAANPEFTINLLQEIQQIVTDWQQELQNLHQQVEELYREGPMINGWLESHSRESTSDRPVSSLRHADIEELMAYIEKLSEQEESEGNSPQVSYQLCGLDEQGKLWSKPCPAEQIPSVSIAIARYQKVRQLLKRKQSLEHRLTQLAENLIVCCSNLPERG
ncbi:hypothetical protein [Merismopedia glauca]|uniref:Uncharacterized protein n=1 Tax=Merismopedia glauca CCAP 1448/3 TaxID=1296344 RepID=A0A2T1BZ14_9CYAN|nr:hypothetical protein [Merismopedia glauca]PSB01275.1 hypothetical protein C7B64_19210 [Merismopedia glauca CCAP 1448/3]